MDTKLGRLEYVGLRNVFKSESMDFTPWLSNQENLSLLGDTIGIEIEFDSKEKEVGPFRADILCRRVDDNSWVLIENQIERTDHSHLGQILTYASGLDAATIIWIAQKFTEEHRSALDWLNEITEEEFAFFGIEVELLKIGDSPVAPRFNIVSKPNNWSRAVQKMARNRGLTESKKLQLKYWETFREHMKIVKSDVLNHYLKIG